MLPHTPTLWELAFFTRSKMIESLVKVSANKTLAVSNHISWIPKVCWCRKFIHINHFSMMNHDRWSILYILLTLWVCIRKLFHWTSICNSGRNSDRKTKDHASWQFQSSDGFHQRKWTLWFYNWAWHQRTWTPHVKYNSVFTIAFYAYGGICIYSAFHT